MTVIKGIPRIVLISQWPNTKNAEYELIEKIRQTGYKVVVVDFLGFDPNTGSCINTETLSDEYDFAIAFHYFTPKFLNIPTFLWVANPLEYMHMLPYYRDVIINHVRGYDDYLYNGSDLLKEHIKQVVGREWQDTDLKFFASCSSKALLEHDQSFSKSHKSTNELPQKNKIDKLFYCGVNWERGNDGVSRAQGLLEILQERQVAHFYGPKDLMGFNPWEGFSSYRGEIPFDGVSMPRTMQGYGAVLAISSPAHMKSHTSSSRVFEGFAAGVPVISDENPHVRQLFGDLVYYFNGTTEKDRAESILNALSLIVSNPTDALDRVSKAQAIISESYCFESCLAKTLGQLKEFSIPVSNEASNRPSIDIFLFYHDPYATPKDKNYTFSNLLHLLKAISVAINKFNAKFRIFYCDPIILTMTKDMSSFPNLEWIALNEKQPVSNNWDGMRLGEKVSWLASFSTSDFAVFLTQSDYPHYDYFIKPLLKLQSKEYSGQPNLYLGGFFSNDLLSIAPLYPHEPMNIDYNNASVGLYRWSQNSNADHQLGQFCFTRQLLELINFDNIKRFDVLFPLAVVFESMSKNVLVYRARHILLRVNEGYFHRHYAAYVQATRKSKWAQHYELVSNYSHELNALYDAFHEYPELVVLADRISEPIINATNNAIEVDPAVFAVNRFIERLRPIYHKLRKLKQLSTFNF